MLRINVSHRVFEIPRIVFTLASEHASVAVINYINTSSDCEGRRNGEQEFVVFENADAVRARFEGGVSPSAAVALFDGPSGGGWFTMRTRSRAIDTAIFPAWTHGAQWGVRIQQDPRRCASIVRTCALQTLAFFTKHFRDRLDRGEYPWGFRKKDEPAPMQVQLPANIGDTIRRLNDGPDLAAAIAHSEHALELPTGSKISWARVVPDPVACDERALTVVVRALQEFEVACGQLLRERPEVRQDVFAGVVLDNDPRLPDLYSDPPTQRFSIDRPDLHWAGDGVFASEVDEMPGGFPELVHIDHAYGVNADRWERCFTWLTNHGKLLFIVSHDWSRCYRTETAWLVEYLRSRGHDVDLRMTDELDDVVVEDGRVMCAGERVGTIWRQFPIFETRGKLVDFVAAARRGEVRMVPEFGHWGNKVWFSLFRKHREFFRRVLDSATFAVLEDVLPDSHLVRSAGAFPCVVDGMTIASLDELCNLSETNRDRLVLKVCGANTLAARSYGVLMGSGLALATWQKWIDERLTLCQPFLIQRRLETSVAHLPVQNTTRGCAELFPCRVLLRPWVVGDEIVSAAGCAVPSNTLRVHGRVDMAILPVRFE